ncbi:MAG: Gfo/Idh/MocA family oxidoreductase [Candidatus Latescibacteria bacterium]|nr:Gfo/Idh/MocA family oxidoreductase [Candidatus Latescibacterota bacterium]
MTKARIGFIGAGWWATSNHMPVLAARQDVELAGVCRLGQAELRQVQERFGFKYATEDYRELLEKCELDGVVVASPHTLHYDHASAALNRGLHVMCEKPMTTRGAHARELVRLAEEKGVQLLVPYGWHYKGFTQQAKQWLDQGVVGKVEHVLCHMASPLRGLLSGAGMKVADISGQSSANLFDPDPKTWADPQVAGGGYGHAQLSHASGLMFWMSGLRAQTVYGNMSAPGAQVELYDAISVRFEGGAIGTVSGAGTVPTDQGFQLDIRIFGSEGMLLLDCERARLELRRDDRKHQSVGLAPDAGEYECSGPPNNFADLILGKTNINWAPGEAAMRAVELLDAAYRSAVSGKPEQV